MKYTQQEYHDILQEALPASDFDFVTFNGTENPCEIVCNKCGSHFTFKVASNFKKRAKRGNLDICNKCETAGRTGLQKQRMEIIKNSSLIPLDFAIEDIRWSWKEKIDWQCRKCGHTFSRAPFAVSYTEEGTKCPWCEANFALLNDEMIDYRIEQTWGNEYTRVAPTTHNSKHKRRFKVRHNQCGFIWEVDCYHFLKERTGCPRCRASKGERKVREYLQKYNFIFEEQKIIPCGGHRVLRFDFYLEKSNKKYAIEYNGIQHYQPVKWFGSEQAFLKQQQCDKDKAEYCKNNDIILIKIPYNDETLLNSDLLAQRLNEQAL